MRSGMLAGRGGADFGECKYGDGYAQGSCRTLPN
jgi:hypothetical protein